MKFTKEHTMQMKGIAIIILLFHHCFLNAQRWATVPYEKLATTKGWGYYPISFAPFSSHTIQYLASFSKICVAMFVFMTGYGMWVSYESQKKKTTMRKYKETNGHINGRIFDHFCCDRDSCDSNWTFYRSLWT